MASPTPSRFDTCRCVLYAAAEGAPPGAEPREIEYRRCPVGVIAAVDCPEFSGATCHAYEPRADAQKQVVPVTEIAHLRAELAADGYPSERYLRRIRPLWTGTHVPVRGRELLATPASDEPSATAGSVMGPTRRTFPPDVPEAPDPASAPINVPSDASRAKYRADRRTRPPGPADPDAPEVPPPPSRDAADSR